MSFPLRSTRATGKEITETRSAAGVLERLGNWNGAGEVSQEVKATPPCLFQPECPQRHRRQSAPRLEVSRFGLAERKQTCKCMLNKDTVIAAGSLGMIDGSSRRCAMLMRRRRLRVEVKTDGTCFMVPAHGPRTSPASNDKTAGSRSQNQSAARPFPFLCPITLVTRRRSLQLCPIESPLPPPSGVPARTITSLYNASLVVAGLQRPLAVFCVPWVCPCACFSRRGRSACVRHEPLARRPPPRAPDRSCVCHPQRQSRDHYSLRPTRGKSSQHCCLLLQPSRARTGAKAFPPAGVLAGHALAHG